MEKDYNNGNNNGNNNNSNNSNSNIDKESVPFESMDKMNSMT